MTVLYLLRSGLEQQGEFRGTAVGQLSSSKLLPFSEVEIAGFSEVSWKSSFVVLPFNQLFALTETLMLLFIKASGNCCSYKVA